MYCNNGFGRFERWYTIQHVHLQSTLLQKVRLPKILLPDVLLQNVQFTKTPFEKTSFLSIGLQSLQKVLIYETHFSQKLNMGTKNQNSIISLTQ
jgi:hypothetical protein